MKPQALHKEAMDWSFKARTALEKGDDRQAYEHYSVAAKCESEAAEFYLDKPELEPTRSLLIRSAAFLNLKAGLVEQSRKFILFGLLHSSNEQIKAELNDALEYSLSLQSAYSNGSTFNYEYLRVLRLRSVNYVLEPTLPVHGSAVTLDMVRTFTEEYLKSLRAYSTFAFRRLVNASKMTVNEIEVAANQFQELVNPLITSASFGSFRFSVANDFLAHSGENDEIVRLKSNVVNLYHEDVFSVPLTDEYIEEAKAIYHDEDIDGIFRPVIKLRAHNSPFKIAYFDSNSFSKRYVGRVTNPQKKKLLPTKQMTPEQIGYLENTIVHTGSYESGKVFRNTLIKQQLKIFELDHKTRYIEAANNDPIMLNEDILLTVKFDSEKGFTFIFEDLHLEFTDITYQKALTGFYTRFRERIVSLKERVDLTEIEQQEWDVVKRIINNPQAIS